MVDPTSDLGENVSAGDAPCCATCGTPIVDDPEHSVVTWVVDGAVSHAHFCDEACRSQWDGPEN